ncbi:MAG: hypothetical protein WKF96_18055, partial [Solirubrobacteraceae bacterium]
LADGEITNALDELDRASLLVSPMLPGDGLSRRELGLKVTKVAVGVASVPLILSIAAPAAAQTASQIKACEALNTGSQNGCPQCQQTGNTSICCCCMLAGAGNDRCVAGPTQCTNVGGMGGMNANDCNEAGGPTTTTATAG